jgi:hypothetical protein
MKPPLIGCSDATSACRRDDDGDLKAIRYSVPISVRFSPRSAESLVRRGCHCSSSNAARLPIARTERALTITSARGLEPAPPHALDAVRSPRPSMA